MLIHRRNLILGIGSILASPAIVRAGSIMPVKTMIWDGRVPVTVMERFDLGQAFNTYAIRRETGEWEVWNPYRKIYHKVYNIPPDLEDGFDMVSAYTKFNPEG